jgi:hypothetical protein
VPSLPAALIHSKLKPLDTNSQVYYYWLHRLSMEKWNQAAGLPGAYREYRRNGEYLMRPKAVGLFLAAFVVAPLCHGNAQNTRLTITARVDQRVELLSVIFRLAGNFEYNMSPLSGYTGDIDSYFSPYKSHPAVTMARSLAEKNGVGFDAVMAMAVHLSDAPALAPVVTFTEAVPEPRWGKASAVKFAELVQAFYRDTRFERFFAAHQASYQFAETRFQQVLAGFNVDWYRNFYGETPKGEFHLILGMNNGGGSYGPKVDFPDNRTEIFAIIGCGRKDASGDPAFASDDLSTIVHEFNHSFINPLIDQHISEFTGAETVYRAVAEKLKVQAYGNARTMLCESLVRAAVILYFESSGENPKAIEHRIIREQALGFVWMDDLCGLLRQYESQRERYPKFSSFIGAAADFYRTLSNHIDDKVAGFNTRCVHVTGILPFPNHGRNVDPSITEITIQFDKPIDPAMGYSINFGAGGPDQFPIVGNPEFLPANQSIKLHVQLKPGWSYGFVLTPPSFASPDGYPVESYAVDFKTR